MPFVLVEWDQVHECDPCYVKLDDRLYNKDRVQYGWNLLCDDYVQWKHTEKEKARVDRRSADPELACV